MGPLSELVKRAGFEHLSGRHVSAGFSLTERESLEPAQVVAFIEFGDLSAGNEDALVPVLNHNERETERLAISVFLADTIQCQRLQPLGLSNDDQSILQGHLAGGRRTHVAGRK